MSATLLATVPTSQMIPGGKDHQPIFKVIVLALLKRFWFNSLFLTEKHLCFMCLLWLKHERRAGSARPSGRAKPTLKIFPIEKIVYVTKETQLPAVIAQR